MQDVTGDNWNTTSYSPTAIVLDYENGSNEYIPQGYEVLPTFCIVESDIAETDIEIKWIDDLGNVCRDTVSLLCSDCGQMEYEVICKEGQWFIQMTITNYTDSVVTSAYIDWCNPALSAYDLNVFTGSLSPLSSFGPFTVPIGPPALVGPNCVNIILHDKEGLVCCRIQSEVILPDCDVTVEECLCDQNFEYQVELGINCTNTGLTYIFSPNGNFDPECDKVVYQIQPLGVTLSSTGNTPVTFTFPSPGEYEICMIVFRLDVNGKECKAKFLKQLTIKNPGQTPLLFPNPSQTDLFVQTKSEYDESSTMRIYNREGKLIFDKQMKREDDKFHIDIQQLPAGLYTLRMTNSFRQWTTAFIKIE
jgi:hypothetical protein